MVSDFKLHYFTWCGCNIGVDAVFATTSAWNCRLNSQEKL